MPYPSSGSRWRVARCGLIERGPERVESGASSFRGPASVRTEKPAALLTTGGFVAGPVAVAARLQGVPAMVFVPDIEPAQSVKAIARLAQRWR